MKITINNETTEISNEAIKLSGLLSSIIEEDINELNINYGSMELFNIVVQFCEYHKNNPFKKIPTPINHNNFKSLVCDFDFNLINDHENIIKLTDFANYLDIEPLIDLCLGKIACMLYNKNESVIKNILNADDISDEELEEHHKIYGCFFSPRTQSTAPLN